MEKKSDFNWRAFGETITISNDEMLLCRINTNGNYNSGIPTLYDREKAELIVNSINSYFDLLEALKKAKEIIDHVLSGTPHGYKEDLFEIEAAIEKATKQ